MVNENCEWTRSKEHRVCAFTKIDRQAFSSDKSNKEWIPQPARAIVDKEDNATQMIIAAAPNKNTTNNNFTNTRNKKL
jgi:hypothetical protein